MKRIAHNGLVGGSSPSGPTIYIKHLAAFLRSAFRSNEPKRLNSEPIPGSMVEMKMDQATRAHRNLNPHAVALGLQSAMLDASASL